jgi:hypothetical protein
MIDAFEHSLITAQNLGFNESIPPFATATGEEILKGVNYASGSAGIRIETGKIAVIIGIYHHQASIHIQLRKYLAI